MVRLGMSTSAPIALGNLHCRTAFLRCRCVPSSVGFVSIQRVNRCRSWSRSTRPTVRAQVSAPTSEAPADFSDVETDQTSDPEELLVQRGPLNAGFKVLLALILVPCSVFGAGFVLRCTITAAEFILGCALPCNCLGSCLREQGECSVTSLVPN